MHSEREQMLADHLPNTMVPRVGDIERDPDPGTVEMVTWNLRTRVPLAFG
jgi:hypothetical protein